MTIIGGKCREQSNLDCNKDLLTQFELLTVLLVYINLQSVCLIEDEYHCLNCTQYYCLLYMADSIHMHAVSLM